MTANTHECDVVVVGHGIAGLSAAVSALEAGARVAVLERAPREEAGGNTRWTEAFMRMKSPEEVADDFEAHFAANAGAYTDPSLIAEAARDYAAWPGIVRAHPFTDPELVGTLAAEAPATLGWLQSLGIGFSPMATYLLTQSTTRIMPNGGGLQLVETLSAEAARRGATIFYETTARSLLEGGRGIRATQAGGKPLDIRAGAVVLACGGFEGNAEMLARYIGPKARYIRPIARGGYHNKGEGIAMGLAAGAAPAGDFTEFHAEPIDPRSGVSEPIVFCFPYGILVNRQGERFVDEASNTVDAIYEAVTRRINEQAEGIAWCIMDARIDDVPGWRRSVRTDQPPVTANTLEELAAKISIPVAALRHTVAQYNAACDTAGSSRFAPLQLDGLGTRDLHPPKSNWARPIAEAPFMAYPITCANCFTFGGLKTDARARVVDTSGEPIPRLYAAGETAGLYHGAYTGATSVLRGAVFGRIAGLDAAQVAAA